MISQKTFYGRSYTKHKFGSEYYVLSCLYRIGANAYLTFDNKKSVDIIIEKPDKLLTIDVKGLKGTTCFPVDNRKKKEKNHYLTFVSFLNKMADTETTPEVYIVPSDKLNANYKELDGESLIYENPKGNRKVVRLRKLRKVKKLYLNNWKPFL